MPGLSVLLVVLMCLTGSSVGGRSVAAGPTSRIRSPSISTLVRSSGSPPRPSMTVAFSRQRYLGMALLGWRTTGLDPTRPGARGQCAGSPRFARQECGGAPLGDGARPRTVAGVLGPALDAHRQPPAEELLRERRQGVVEGGGDEVGVAPLVRLERVHLEPVGVLEVV